MTKTPPPPSTPTRERTITGGGRVGRHNGGTLNKSMTTYQHEYGCSRAVPLSSRAQRERSTIRAHVSIQKHGGGKGKRQIIDNRRTSLSQRYFCATRLISSGFTASMAFSICLGDILWPQVTSCRPISSAMAVVPSRPSNKLALSWLFARSTSATVGETLIRVHSRSVKCSRSSRLTRFSDTR